MHALTLVLALVPALLALGCRPDLGRSTGAAGGGGAGGAGAIELVLEPDAPADAAPLALRIRIRGAALDPTAVWLVAGEVGPGHLRQLAAGDPSNALAERIVPASAWLAGGELVLAPHGRLAPAEAYAVALADRATTRTIVTAAADDGGEALVRTWPPVDALAAVARAVLCGPRDLPPIERGITLDPAGVDATVARGAASSGAGRRCVRLVAPSPVPAGEPLLPPPSITAGGVDLALDPTPLVVGDGAAPPTAPIACDGSEVRFGPGCARVADDRAIVRTPDAPTLWVVSGAGVDQVTATAASEPFVVRSLPPSTALTLEVSATDVAGREAVGSVSVHTGAPGPHPILNEILADPVAPDATAEWIEIVNDGAAPAALGGLRILDVGGEIPLPAVDLAPGAFALVVDADWTPDPALDAVPPPGALVIRVPQLGRGGLANAGELLRLVDDGGAVISAVAPLASKEAGVSIARREPWLADTPSSFAPGTPTPGAANVIAPVED
jgi:hypothetical protein